MPPKAVRGGAGRGRGRGRGKATASDPAAADSPAPDVQMADAPASQSETAPASEAPAPAVSTPQLSETGDNSFSPNSSPATIPTETPAPTPAHSGPGASSGAATSQPASDASSASKAGPSTRGGRGGARGGAKAPSKFKPKANRADATKLAELARKEEARLAGIAATKAREEARALRGRGRPARGRGDAMGRSSRGGGGSGLFGALPESIKNSSTGFTRLGGGGGGGGSGVSGIKTESGPSRSGGYTGGGGGGGGGGGRMGGFNKDYVPEPHYPGEDGDAPRVDIAMINLVPEDEDDEIQYIGTKSIRKTGLRPVRLDRHEHKARVTIVNTGPVIKIEDDEDGVEVDETRSSSRPGPADTRMGDPRDEISIKTEPGLAATFRHISPDSTSTVEPLSPESKRKVKPELKMDDDAAMTGVLGEKKAQPKKKRAHKQVIQTEEDKAEYERHLEDVAILASELGGLQGNLTDKSKGTDGQEDVLMEEAAPKPEDKRSGRLYLFQFPPILPELYDPVKGKPIDPKKMHDLSADGNGDVEVSGTGTSAKSKAKARDRADLTGESVAIKMEEETISIDKAKMEEEKRSKGKRTPYVHEEGWIGKLVVRQSGKVELSWGGVNLLVGRGVDAGFLTTGIVVDGLEKGPVGGGAPEGRAMSMGQIMGKFVVTPDMENLV
ncbi:DNA-directed RNA polymerase III RPC4 [Drepanopeziza brunnea f. sp. 'multigermtubi' MB_m1]|uniref:DNA-directed RNA polymerase III RPC4 n=1 Tax=Marssonina brunnea f. sp. multigermtubi (strain MB_m1) TaxID=1072389 RepID=K1WK22_MARBU|nr:DNA-directed RNA polymerase III RPC4 [Drepanopeziza brunnea f. sp. 'multigermtubi' MB_m1]EKD18045.1 DNA-directed RNA polymerase III RPC4 [Drepanopeziza brunnea f. sp. 'multigermtubi' MB_m1]